MENTNPTIEYENSKEENQALNFSFQNINRKKFSESEAQIRENVAHIVDSIAASVELLQDNDDDDDDTTNNFDNSDKNSTTLVNDEILSEPLANLVSKIQVADEIDDNSDTNEIITGTTTFEMTEVLNSVSIDSTKMISKETETDYSQIIDSERDSTIDDNDNDDLEIEYTDEQLERAYTEFKTKNILPSILMRDPLLEYARRLSLQYIIDEEYDKAKQNDKDVNNLLQSYKNNGYNSFSDYGYSGLENWSNLKTNLEARLEIAKKQQTTNNIKFKERIQYLKKEEERKLQELENIHEKERQFFIESCSAPSFLHRFSKPSSNLLQMRQMQKNLALQHKFNEAKEMKIEADELQRKETRAARLRASECVKNLYKMIVQKQFNQKQCIMENTERKKNIIEENFLKEMDVNKNLTNLLEIRINEMNQKISTNSSPLPNSCIFINSGKFSNSINQSYSSPSSTLPPLNPTSTYSVTFSRNMKRKREMITQARRITSKLDVKLTNVKKLFVGARKMPTPVLSNTF